jgi:carboxylesterase type B
LPIPIDIAEEDRTDIDTTDAGLSPVVEIAAGKLRGKLLGGIYSFKGIPYGASTAGRRRFMPPEPPLPWSDVREALAYATRARQLPNRPKCLNLNRNSCIGSEKHCARVRLISW